ncbi:hypothetical protein AcW2_005886 [Taiwanofungus camphoratus]|nr:hypothetical protein AcW2_005886 [Antrodia cinnamomea]
MAVGKLVFDFDESRSVITEFGVVGRGTTVVPVKATGKVKVLFGEDDLRVKAAWPPKEHYAEDGFVRAIRTGLEERAPRWLDHVVDLKCSVTRKMGEMDFPRSRMSSVLGYEERVFRVIVMKVLQMVDSVDEFKKIFVDVVSGKSVRIMLRATVTN